MKLGEKLLELSGKYGILCPGSTRTDEAVLSWPFRLLVSESALRSAGQHSGTGRSSHLWDFPPRSGFLNLSPVDGWSREVFVWELSCYWSTFSSIPGI